MSSESVRPDPSGPSSRPLIRCRPARPDPSSRPFVCPTGRCVVCGVWWWEVSSQRCVWCECGVWCGVVGFVACLW